MIKRCPQSSCQASLTAANNILYFVLYISASGTLVLIPLPHRLNLLSFSLPCQLIVPSH